MRDLGFTNTVEADDGLTAIPILNSGSIDFLVTDWNMPGMTGIDLLRHVRADEKLRSLPVLMVTAEAKREQIIEAACRGQRLRGQAIHGTGLEREDRENLRTHPRLMPSRGAMEHNETSQGDFESTLKNMLTSWSTAWKRPVRRCGAVDP